MLLLHHFYCRPYRPYRRGSGLVQFIMVTFVVRNYHPPDYFPPEKPARRIITAEAF